MIYAGYIPSLLPARKQACHHSVPKYWRHKPVTTTTKARKAARRRAKAGRKNSR